LPGDGSADIGLLLVVGGQDLDGEAVLLRPEVRDGLAGGEHAGRA